MGMTFSRAEALAVSLGAASDRLASTLDDLDRSLSSLGENWSGAAAEALQQARVQTAASLVALNAVLRQAEQATAIIADRHRTAEAEVQALWE